MYADLQFLETLNSMTDLTKSLEIAENIGDNLSGVKVLLVLFCKMRTNIVIKMSIS